jgi:hypothetical protein
LKDGTAFIFRVKQCFLLDYVTLEMKVLRSLENVERHSPGYIFTFQKIAFFTYGVATTPNFMTWQVWWSRK